MMGLRARFARSLRQLSAAVSLLFAVAVVSLIVWAREITAADPTAEEALASNQSVMVRNEEWIILQPRDLDPLTGVIFYPAARADPVAYAPILSRIAADGYLVVITPMPLNLPVLAPQRARRVMARFPAVRQWVIAGHRLGGAVAAAFASERPQRLAGLILWAAYPVFDDLSGGNLATLCIYASLDTLTTPGDVSQARRRLPADTSYVEVVGGDHWNFAHFQPQPGTALISREDQQAQIVEATLAFLRRVAPPPMGGTTV